MQYDQLITDDLTYASIEEEFRSIFVTSSKLPNNVFCSSMNLFYLFRFEELSYVFPEFLIHLANRYQDKDLRYRSINPDPVSYYRERLGFFGAASFSVNVDKTRYSEVMSRGGQADSFEGGGGNLGAFWGTSCRWGIYCDRISWEICVLGVESPLVDTNTAPIRFLDKTGLMGYEKALYFTREETAEKFVGEFLNNYRGIP